MPHSEPSAQHSVTTASFHACVEYGVAPLSQRVRATFYISRNSQLLHGKLYAKSCSNVMQCNVNVKIKVALHETESVTGAPYNIKVSLSHN